ncbi:MAG: dihydrofolate reductase [Deltaproteobacteria bacterium]|nr:dihydrofolate reductase [Deltaproteobacteria bacterium]
MKAPFLSCVVAADRNGAIGTGGKLPWRMPADLRHFKIVTFGHPVIMGRKTYESIGKPLHDRTNIVITRNKAFRADGCLMTGTFAEAVERAKSSPGSDEVFVIGGAEIYALALPQAERIYFTLIETKVPGADAFFPKLDPKVWRLAHDEPHPADAQNPFAFRFQIYLRS